VYRVSHCGRILKPPQSCVVPGSISLPSPAIILFDGHCHLCHRTVQFVLRRDREARFLFAPLSSEAARRECARIGVTAEDARALESLSASVPDSVLVIADGRILARSDASLAIAARLPFPWRVLAALRVVPRPLRDWAYGIVARNRYRWFGRSDACLVPTSKMRARFLE
jgi:predicted DCC family thiol-disulfide oxidoreductase YuxK